MNIIQNAFYNTIDRAEHKTAKSGDNSRAIFNHFNLSLIYLSFKLDYLQARLADNNPAIYHVKPLNRKNSART